MSRKIQTQQGFVVSNKMDKTAVVKVMRIIKHFRYQKYLKQYNKYHVHDESNTCLEGDLVSITKSKKHSKTKNWTLIKIVQRAEI